MNHLSTILSIFAAPPDRQSLLLCPLPKNPGASDFHTNFERNALLVAVLAYLEYFNRRDNESRDDYLDRMGLPSDFTPIRTTIEELEYVLGTFRPATSALWTLTGLERKPEWRLVRRIAAIILAEHGWSDEPDAGQAKSLLQTYSERLRSDWREYGRPW